MLWQTVFSDYGVKEKASEGRPPYDSKGVLKLYVYGSDNGIKSLRKLAKSYKVNVEVRWMLGGEELDFRTIADFRKDNIDRLKKIFNEFNKRLARAVEWGFTLIDGSNFAACNVKNNNFSYFLLRGIRKVTREFVLMCMGYNIKRAKNLLGFEKMMELMAVGAC